jgi:hypothetical protein
VEGYKACFPRWKIVQSHNIFSGGRLEALFFCHDVTDRAFRVASDDDKTKTTHSCGAAGIVSCEILVPEGRIHEYLNLYEKILGSEAEAKEEAARTSLKFDVGITNGVQRAKVIVREARSERDLIGMKE